MRRIVRLVAGLSLAPLAFTLGCGLIPSTTTVQTASPASQLKVGGSVHGGNQPVIGATVQLWQVGTTGYGLGSQALGGSVQS